VDDAPPTFVHDSQFYFLAKAIRCQPIDLTSRCGSRLNAPTNQSLYSLALSRSSPVSQRSVPAGQSFGGLSQSPLGTSPQSTTSRCQSSKTISVHWRWL